MEDFEEANRLYRAEDFGGAVDLYLKILESGYDSGELHYNLGNAYFKTGQLGLAILHYEKAKKIFPRDGDLNYNLSLASMRVADRITVPRLFIWKYLDGVRDYFALNTLAILTLVFFLAALGTAATYHFLPRGFLKKLTFYSTVPLLMVFLLFGVTFSARIWRAETVREGIIIVDKVEIVSAPDEGAKGLFSLHEGVKVRIGQELPPWVEIALPDGKKGWLIMDALAEI